jgi:hypothetical protein
MLVLVPVLACNPFPSYDGLTGGHPDDSGAPVAIDDGAPMGSEAGAPVAIDAMDILAQAQASIPFASQTRWSAQVMGTFPSAASIPESGIQGPLLPNGDTIRFGKVVDPTNAARMALVFQLASGDPPTAGFLRSEIAVDKNAAPVTHGNDYWIAFSAYIYDWSSSTETAEFGTRLLSGDNSLGLGSIFTLMTQGAQFWVEVQANPNSSPSPSTTTNQRVGTQTLPFGRWIGFAFKFREGTTAGAASYLKVWMDGAQIVDYSGLLGFNLPGDAQYAKFGYSNSNAFTGSRKMLLRSPVLVADPTGKYGQNDLRAFVEAH